MGVKIERFIVAGCLCAMVLNCFLVQGMSSVYKKYSTHEACQKG